ncbi:MAG: hypothetical protein IPK77_06680 [Cellvibrio sp.]|nr:hypothetical protein [Cellvibrio sp.]
MHEVHRQEYLTSMGIESYIPRWRIPFAAESHLCDQSYDLCSETKQDSIVATSEANTFDASLNNIVPAIDLQQVLKSVSEKPVVKNSPFRADEILQQVESKALHLVQPFSLSVWRPAPDFLILAARNLNAMPTELLLNNFLRFHLNLPQLTLSEEVLRWPAIENNKIALTEHNAIAELQTWLSVQHEFQPINRLWFFGGIYRYFVSDLLKLADESHINSCDIYLDQFNVKQPITAKIFPDMTRFLQQPELKEQLLSLV